MQDIDTSRTARRQELSARIAKAGGRVVLEALLDPRDLDRVLEDFGRLPPRLYHAVLYRADALTEEAA